MTSDATQRRVILTDPAGWIASGFGSGLSPYAPGTAGSVAAVVPWIALRELPLPFYVVALLLAFALGVWASNRVIAMLGIDDPGVIVWDEFVGQWIAWTPLLLLTGDWRWLVVGFALFRLFDIWKPWPVSWADRRIKGGFGVMFDDVLAGLYAAALLTLALHLS